MSNCDNEVNSTLISSLGYIKYIYNSILIISPTTHSFHPQSLPSTRRCCIFVETHSHHVFFVQEPRLPRSGHWSCFTRQRTGYIWLRNHHSLLVQAQSFRILRGLSLTNDRDCCKGSCSWPGKASVSSPVATCSKDDSPLTDSNAASACDGGDAHMCSNQSPWVVNDNLAYGFAAVSAGGSESDTCCSCYQYVSQWD